MSTQPLDYAKILADLEAKRTAIDMTIASVRSLLGVGVFPQTGEIQSTNVGGIDASQVVPSASGNEIPDGAFFGKSVPEATKLLLEIVKRKQTTREIADGLRRGGIESTSSNFVGIVHVVLNRARRTPNSALVKLGSYWGLKDWYPKGIVSAGAPERSKRTKKKAKKKTTKAASVQAQDDTQESPVTKPLLIRSIIKPGILIGHLLANNPDVAYSPAELAAKVGLNEKVAAMLAGQLVNKNQATKTRDGKYRYLTAPPIAAAQ